MPAAFLQITVFIFTFQAFDMHILQIIVLIK